MEFSSSFNFGNSTLLNIEKAVGESNHPPDNKLTDLSNYISPQPLEIIEESPTNKSNKNISTRRNRDKVLNAITQSKQNIRKFKKSKSDSLLHKSPPGKIESLFNISAQKKENNHKNHKQMVSASEMSALKDNENQHKIQHADKLSFNIDEHALKDFFDDSSFPIQKSTSIDGFSRADRTQGHTEEDIIISCGEIRTESLFSENPLEKAMFCSENLGDFDSHTEEVAPLKEILSSEPLGRIIDAREEIIPNPEEISFLVTADHFSQAGINEEVKTLLTNETEKYKQAISKRSTEECEEPINMNHVKTSQMNRSAPINLSTSDVRLLNWSESSHDTSMRNESKDLQHSLANMFSDPSANPKYLSSWNLPSTILNEYQKKGIKEMFDWQVECLSNPKVLFENSNLVYSAPTSAGKTLVSEMLAIKTVLERKKKVIIILPFISVVREKMSYLQDLLTSSGYRVEGFFGGYSPPPGGFDAIDIAICTIEKANSIVNKLLEQQKFENIGMIIVDEIHLISDAGRGYILELLLAKTLFMCQKFGYKIQIVVMSATLPNVELLQKWLRAEYFVTCFRPVALHEMLKLGNRIYDNQMKFIRSLKPKDFEVPIQDQDNISLLCVETLLDKCSVIVFCPSKDQCENLCTHIARCIYLIMRAKTAAGIKLAEILNSQKLNEVKDQLRNSPTGLDAFLEKTISFGCAFHHAGLTMDERDIVETNFKEGSLKIIVATNTLSSGVNLPARRVIIRTPLFGNKPMNSITYKQMIGRAGRTGKDTLGESILICTEANANAGKDLLQAELKPLTSCLDVENSVHLKRAMLEVISSGVATTQQELQDFTCCTLLYSEKSTKLKFLENEQGDLYQNLQKRKIMKKSSIDEEKCDPILESMEFLLDYEFIRLQLNEETQEMNFVATRLGLACLSSSMPPNDGILLFSELQRARQCFVLETELHAVYLVTPYSVCYQLQDLDWLVFLDMWEKLSVSMKKVGELVGIKDSFLAKAMRGNSKLDYKSLQIHKRFYTALALNELVNETPINVVAVKYKLSRGLLQSLQQMASTFAGIVTSFCTSLNWTMLALIVSQFKERLFFGIHRDLIDLMRISDLNAQKARSIFNAGIKNLVDLANANSFTIEKILYNSISFDTKKKRDDENEYDAHKRNEIRRVFVTGKSGVSINDAAKMLIDQARQFLKYEMGGAALNWSQESKRSEDDQQNTNAETSRIEKQLCQLVVKKSFKEAPKRKLIEANGFMKSIERNLLSSPQKIAKTTNKNEPCSPPTKFSMNFHSKRVKKRAEYQTSEQFNPKIIRRSPRNHVSNNQELNSEEEKVNSTWNSKTSPMANKSNEEILSSQQFSEASKISTKTNPSITHRIKTIRKAHEHSKSRLDLADNTENSSNSKVNASKQSSIEISDLSTNNSLFTGPKNLNASHILSTSKTESSGNFNRLNIVNICKNYQLFEAASEEIANLQQIGLSIGIEKLSKKSKFLIGGNVITNQTNNSDCETDKNFIFNQIYFVAGVSIAVDDTFVAYLDLQTEGTDIENVTLATRTTFLKNIFGSTIPTICMFDAKEQMKILNKIIPNFSCASATIEDPRVAHWLLQPDIDMSFQKMVQQYAPECIRLNHCSSITGKIRSAIEACIIPQILRNQMENLERIELRKFYHDLEMPIQKSLHKMETLGFPVSENSLQKLSSEISDELRIIEQQIYQMHGSRFNLSSSSAVARVLGLHKKPNGRYNTTKQILGRIDSPISNLIVAYRKLAVILSKNIQPLLRSILNDRIHGSSITFTMTGRISMREPNLQNVAKDVEVDMPGRAKKVISCRKSFIPNSNKWLISADFCQLEFRILTFLSQDATLLKIMQSDNDIFTLIAAQWNRISESEVSSHVRNATKQICYGIIYGMGLKSLSEILKCEEQDAAVLTEQFHLAYPSIRSYTQKIKNFAKQNGFVETITGRRRYLPQIDSTDSGLRSQAERQALNSTIQGSAADIAKNAILKMEKNLIKYQKELKINRPDDKTSSADFVLHLHDELIFEVPKENIKKICTVLKRSMENCVQLNVPLRVRLKVGPSWGQLNEIKL